MLPMICCRGCFRCRRLFWPVGVQDDIDEVAALEAGDVPLQDVSVDGAERGLRPRRDAVGERLGLRTGSHGANGAGITASGRRPVVLAGASGSLLTSNAAGEKAPWGTDASGDARRRSFGDPVISALADRQ
jgi:hypothetical protein